MINYINEGVSIKFRNRRKTTQWIKDALWEEGKNKAGEINIVFCTDEYLREKNRQYLSHDYYTDIITFDNSGNNIRGGDLLVSVDRVKENAKIYRQSFIDELHRVIIHGILHILGYSDNNKKESGVMKEKEDYYLKKRK